MEQDNCGRCGKIMDITKDTQLVTISPQTYYEPAEMGYICPECEELERKFFKEEEDRYFDEKQGDQEDE